MQIKDEGIIIYKHQIKDQSAIIKVLTKNYGVYSGFVRNAINKKNDYQLGNIVECLWTARINESLGFLKCESVISSSPILFKKMSLYGLKSILSITSNTLEERVPYQKYFKKLSKFLLNSMHKFSFLEYVMLEMELLSSSGYHIELNTCGVTNKTNDLYYVSKKIGKAISKEIGDQHKDRLLILPQFIINRTEPQNMMEIRDALLLLTYFFQKYLFTGGMPNERILFQNSINLSN